MAYVCDLYRMLLTYIYTVKVKLLVTCLHGEPVAMMFNQVRFSHVYYLRCFPRRADYL